MDRRYSRRRQPEPLVGHRYHGPMSPQRLLLAVGLPAGLLVALLLPPWTGYDEFSHFSRAVDIASGSILPE